MAQTHTTLPLWLSELRALGTLATPVVLSQFATQAFTLINTGVLGRLGPDALAASGLANAWYYLLFMVLLGVMLSVGPRAAQHAGSGDTAGLALSFRAGLRLATGLAAVGVPLLLALCWQLRQLAPPDVDRGQTQLYLLCLTAGLWPALLGTSARSVLEASGQARTVTVVFAGGVGILLLLSPTLAFGWGVLPALGLLGAGLALLLSYGLVYGVLLWLAWRRTRAAMVGRAELQTEVRQLFSIGWPIGLTLGAEGGMFNVVSLLMSRFGATALASHNLTLQLISALFMIPLGLANATSVRVGQAQGAKDQPRIRRAGMLGIGSAMAVMVLFGLMEWFWPSTLLGLFIDVQTQQNHALVALSVQLLAIAALFAVMDGAQVATSAALRGLQDTRVPLLISLVAYWVVGVGLGAWLAFHRQLGPLGLWYGLAAGLTVAAIALIRRFWRLAQSAQTGGGSSGL